MIEQFRRAVLDTGDIVAAIGTAVDSVAAEAYRADMAQKALGQARVDAMGYAPNIAVGLLKGMGINPNC